MLALVLPPIHLRALVDAQLHGPDHLQLGDLIEQLLILRGRRRAAAGRGLLVLQILLGLFQGLDHLAERGDDVLFNGLRDLAHVHASQAALDVFHVVAHLGKDFVEGDRRTLRFEHFYRLGRLLDNLLFAIGQAKRILLIGARGLLVVVAVDGPGHGLGAVVDLDLHRQHLLAAGLQLGQQPLEFLLAELPQEVFELLLGLLQLVAGLFGVIESGTLLVLGNVLFGLVLIPFRVLNALASILRIVGLLVVVLLVVVVLGVTLLLLLAATLGRALTALGLAALGAALAVGTLAALGIGGLLVATLAALGAALLAALLALLIAALLGLALLILGLLADVILLAALLGLALLVVLLSALGAALFALGAFASLGAALALAGLGALGAGLFAVALLPGLGLALLTLLAGVRVGLLPGLGVFLGLALLALAALAGVLAVAFLGLTVFAGVLPPPLVPLPLALLDSPLLSLASPP